MTQGGFLHGLGHKRTPDGYGWKRTNQHFQVLRRTEVHHRSGIFGSSDFFGNVYGGGNVNTLYLQCHNTGQACPGIRQAIQFVRVFGSQWIVFTQTGNGIRQGFIS
jgi:hypothetical protein